MKVGLVIQFFLISTSSTFGQIETHIRKKFEIHDGIAPKSVVASGNGLFSAQNMMYRHTVTFYNSEGIRVAKINDAVNLNEYGHTKYSNEKTLGSPVEGVFTKDGKTLWISNYHMSGTSFTNPGCDDCIGKGYDPGFIYKINTESFEIENVIEVGSVPKFMAISDDESRLIVSNWVSSDVSIIDLNSETELKRITVGTHPRGIAITEDEKFAYVTIMGSTKVIEINLITYEQKAILNVGKSPRSVLLGDNDSTLYISLNSSHEILKYNRYNESRKSCKTAAGPRSMTLSPNGKHLYVVNYLNDSFTKIRTDSMAISAFIETSSKPIGICGNWEKSEIWVACYSGKIEVFKDFELEREMNPPQLLGFKFPIFNFNFDSNLIDENSVQGSESRIIESKLIAESFKTKKTPRITKKRPIIKSVEKAEETIHSIEFNSISCSFHIIVGAFSKAENAEQKQKEMKDKNFSSQVIKGKDLTYVTAGCYDTEENAEKGKSEFIKNNPNDSSAWILRH